MPLPEPVGTSQTEPRPRILERVLYLQLEKLIRSSRALQKALLPPKEGILRGTQYSESRPPFHKHIPFQSFDRKGIYAVSNWYDTAGERDPARDLGGFRGAIKDDLNAAGRFVIAEYNNGSANGFMGDILRNRTWKGNLTIDHFIGGLYRLIPNGGIEYELHFEDPLKGSGGNWKRFKVTLLKRFSPLQGILAQDLERKAHRINIVLPLMGRHEAFRRFLERLVDVSTSTDVSLFLTVVYFGQKGKSRMEDIIRQTNMTNWRERIYILPLTSSTFSRAKGIQHGVEKWLRGDDIMFFCDVDIVFNKDFVDRCILHTHPGEKVYSPIVFSLYNPKIVYFFENKDPPAEQEQLTISKHKGFWRDFGFGMACMYKSDFMSVGGYRTWNQKGMHTGWGFEDVDLYMRLVGKVKLTVVRAPDPGLFHLWHPKFCSKNLSPKRYLDCRKSQIVNEATHQHLGLLHMKEWRMEFDRKYGKLYFQ